MRYLKELSLVLALSLTATTFAQEKEILDFPKEKRVDYQFKGNWTIKKLKDHNGYEIFGDLLTNETNKISDDLFMEAYFIPKDSDIYLNNIPNKINNSIQLGRIEGNKTRLRNIRINFTEKEASKLEDGSYELLLLLRSANNAAVLNYKVIDMPINISNNEFIIKNAVHPSTTITVSETVEVSKPAIENSNNTEIVTENFENITGYIQPKNDYRTYESSIIDYPTTSDRINLSGVWKLEVNFDTAQIKISGINNSVNNKTDYISNDLKLMVFFSKDEPVVNGSLNGFQIVSIDLGRFKPQTSFIGSKIETNIFRLIPKGTYFASLVLLEKNSTGGYDEVSAVRFDDNFTL